jgi:8-oxo-dGTP pyrophosphatase MutT (NUDIX family)
MSDAERIEVIARGACVKDGNLLLCHSKGAENTFLPGGHVEFQEGAAAGLCREIEEELGAQVSAGRFLGVVEHTFLQRGERHCEINLVFDMDLPEVDPPAAPVSKEGGIEFLWVGMNELATSRLEPSPLRELLPPWLDERGGCERWASTY